MVMEAQPMNDKELIQALSEWCDGLRRAISDHLDNQEKEIKRLRLALHSWDIPSKRVLDEKHVDS